MADQKTFLDVFVTTFFDEQTGQVRVKPLPNQAVGEDLLIQCSHRARLIYPLGTIFKLDLILQKGTQGKPFLRARSNNEMPRAIEYFDHNLALQRQKEANKQ